MWSFNTIMLAYLLCKAKFTGNLRVVMGFLWVGFPQIIRLAAGVGDKYSSVWSKT